MVAVEEVLELQEAVAEVYVDDLVQRWIVDLVRATREVDGVMVGASVRGTLALERVARAWALLGDRPYVAPDDVDRLFLPVIAHRVVFAPSFLAETRLLPAREALERFRAACLGPGSGPRGRALERSAGLTARGGPRPDATPFPPAAARPRGG